MNHKPHMTVRIAGLGASVQNLLPFSGEGVGVFISPPLKFYSGLTAGGVLGLSGFFSDPFPIPDTHFKEMGTGLTNWSIRVKVSDFVFSESHTDIEVTFYKPDGQPLTPFLRRVLCKGVVIGGVDVDATLTARNLAGSPLEKFEKGRFEKLNAPASK